MHSDVRLDSLHAMWSLYYLAGSLFFILYSYYYYLRGSFSLSAIIGMISLIFRQTNIVWVFFMALCNVSKNLHRLVTWAFLNVVHVQLCAITFSLYYLMELPLINLIPLESASLWNNGNTLSAIFQTDNLLFMHTTRFVFSCWSTHGRATPY